MNWEFAKKVRTICEYNGSVGRIRTADAWHEYEARNVEQRKIRCDGQQNDLTSISSARGYYCAATASLFVSITGCESNLFLHPLRAPSFELSSESYDDHYSA